MNVLVVDVGGTHVKILATGQTEQREFESGEALSAQKMADQVKALAQGWRYDAVAIGYPGPVKRNQPTREPHNLGAGWVDFDYPKAFGRPVRMINDAAMQALGDYDGGHMLFLGLGTGLGTTMIVDGTVVAMEAGHLPYRKRTFEDYVGVRGLKHYGKRKWRRHVADVVAVFVAAFQPDDVVLGGGNARLLKEFPPGTRLGENEKAFLGGFRLFEPQGKARPAPRAQKRTR